MTLSVFQSSVVNNSGDVQAGAEIEVVNEATGLPADLYSTRAGAVTTNPMFADADGFFRFYTDAGEYRITATSGVFSKTFRYVRIGDAGAKDAVEFLSASDAVNFLSAGDGPVVSRRGDFMTYGGTANAITLTSSNTESLGTVQDGDKLRFKATTTNTGAATIAVDGGPAISCLTPTGAALPAGFIRTDVFTECEYNGANFVVSRKVEKGDVTNGRWTRFEDGTQVTAQSIQQTGIPINTAAVNIFRSAYFSGLTFPKSFSAQPNCSFSVSDSNSYVWIGNGGSAATNSVSSNYVVFAPNSIISEDVKVTATAEGKWY
jgi:hypothetical protein